MSGAALFRWSAAAALALHAALLLSSDGVRGGADLKPHLRLVQQMAEDPGIRSVYPPAYHALGALAAPLLGLAAYPEWFAWLAAAALIAAFRELQRAAELPDEGAALFALAPYSFALTWCLPKVEVAGYALALLGLASLLRGRYVLVSICLVGAFLFHTATALFLGLCGGVLALSLGDRRGLAALAAGTALALPLPLLHLADGCSLSQALLFSQEDYLRAAPRRYNLEHWDRILLLANPIGIAAALAGAGALWRRSRALAGLCGLIVWLYLNELWLAPFGVRTTLDTLRGLTILAIPVALAGGVALGARPRLAGPAVIASGLLALATTFWVTPSACVSRPLSVTGVERFDVDRCRFRWRPRRPAPTAPASGARSQRGQVRPDPLVDRTAALEGAAQRRHGLLALASHGVGARDPLQLDLRRVLPAP
jgi:hypothetical protein